MKTYYDPEEFPFLLPLKNSWEKIKSEYNQIQSNTMIWPQDIHNGKWDVIGLRFEGKNLPMLNETPTLIEICSNPIFYTFGFSIMRSGAEIYPHKGLTNKLLRAHLTLYSNDMCGLLVENKEYIWKEGDLMVFDDTLTHSAWNRGSTDRVILLLDFFKDLKVTQIEEKIEDIVVM
jgi:beta-hydroxylase